MGSAQEECGGGVYSWALETLETLETLALEPLARAQEEAPSLGGCMLLHRVRRRCAFRHCGLRKDLLLVIKVVYHKSKGVLTL